MSAPKHCWQCMRYTVHDVIPPVFYDGKTAAPSFLVCGWCGHTEPIEDDPS